MWTKVPFSVNMENVLFPSFHGNSSSLPAAGKKGIDPNALNVGSDWEKSDLEVEHDPAEPERKRKKKSKQRKPKRRFGRFGATFVSQYFSTNIREI